MPKEQLLGNLRQFRWLSICVGSCFVVGFGMVAACGESAARKGFNGGSGLVPPPTATVGATTTGTAKPTAGANYTVSVKAASVDLRTFGTGVNECTDLTATLTAAGKPAVDVEVTFEAVATDGQKDKGEANPAKARTDEKGTASSKYCSGKEEGEIVVKAVAGASSANTAEIKVTSVPAYRFSWKDRKSKSFAQRAREVKSSSEKLTELLSSSPEDTDAAKPIPLSLRGSSNDCTQVEFELTRDGLAVSGEKIAFATQEEFPVGVKLAVREGTGLTKDNPVSGKSYAYYEATSNADGVFQVPVCSGTLPGNIQLSASYLESDGRVHDTKSPLIVMSGGVANYGFLSLTFDALNSRVVSADTFTNTQKILAFIARLGTLNDGAIIKSYPLSAVAEMGKVLVEGNGFPNDAGEVKFKYEALNLSGQRPFAKHPTLPDLQYNVDSGYSACDPLRFSSTGPIPFFTLAENWRSTLVYYIRGAEFARVNNTAGVFDATKAFGIWDVNQNGVYDGNFVNNQSIDQITFVPANRTQASFNPSVDDWFIDLPGPFVDANENGQYDGGEPLIGDKYSEPNKKYDTDAYIWKSVVLPLNLGATAYSLQHSRISSTVNDYTPTTEWTNYLAFLQSLNTAGYGTRILSSNDTQLFGRGTTIETSDTSPIGMSQYLYFHAQDKCGNPLPGGKKISANYVVDVEKARIGPRDVTAHFSTQPYDGLREASKRLLSKADGSSEAIVNFDILDHPAKKASYPIEMKVTIGACRSECTGDLHPDVANNPPVFCSAETGRMELTVEGDVTISHNVSIPEVFENGHGGVVNSQNKCGCAIGATRQGSVCKCPTGTSLSDATGTCVLPP
ncbi:MAG: hypothetical protein IOD12_13980 [Silvanigrellales bacterium]|nr:hypothetical protein [Silvanigrellales bacterium]